VALNGLFVDLTPLRRSRDYRLLWLGQLVSFFGSQLTVVAVPFEVYKLTHSSLQVGLVSLGQLVPLLIGSLAGGAIIDAHDKRRLMIAMQVLLAGTGVGLAVNAMRSHPAVWPLYVVTAIAALLSGVDRPARTAAIPALVDPEQLALAFALWQILIQLGTVIGPAVAGLLLQAGFATVYWIDVATFGAALVAAVAIAPLPPQNGGTPASWGSIVEGLRYLYTDRLLAASFAIDLDAMIFGLPRAIFPALALMLYHGGAGTFGLLNAAPGAGALVASVLMGWVQRVRRQGLAVVISVVVWGLSIAAFGVVPVLWIGLVLLAIAGGADAISAVFRNTILQSAVPEALRGRSSATFIAVVTGGPRLGDAEAGAAAAIGGAQFAVWSGGLACVVGALAVAWRIPELLRYDATAVAQAAGEGSNDAGDDVPPG
jgi:hypothetical protein